MIIGIYLNIKISKGQKIFSLPNLSFLKKALIKNDAIHQSYPKILFFSEPHIKAGEASTIIDFSTSPETIIRYGSGEYKNEIV